MIKVDLITGFLGAGKTTFIKEYARYFMNQGQKVGILENDYGAVNVDMLLLQDLRGENCELEMVAGGCDSDCHKRRFKTKLISMGMSGYKRVLIEPSGIFDMDEFFDTLRESPLDNWFEIGNVICVLDAKTKISSEEEKFILSSELSNSGCIVLSKLDLASEDELMQTLELVKQISEGNHCKRELSSLIINKKWSDYTEDDFNKIANSGYQICDYVKKISAMDAGYETLYFLEHGLGEESLRKKVHELFSDEDCGNVLRLKGFFQENDCWYELNATKDDLSIHPVKAGQDVMIVIGHNLDKTKICM